MTSSYEKQTALQAQPYRRAVSPIDTTSTITITISSTRCMAATAIISKLRLMSSSSQWVRDCSFQHLRAQQAAALKHA